MNISPIGQNQLYNQNLSKPSFKGVILSRVVLQEPTANGGVKYVPHVFSKRAVIQIYDSLVRGFFRANKNENILDKLSYAIPDFNPKKPIMRTTGVTIDEPNRRYILTGFDAVRARELARIFQNGGTSVMYKEAMHNQILGKKSRRLLDKDGDEISVNVIVKRTAKKKSEKPYYDVVDIDIVKTKDIDMPKYAVMTTDTHIEPTRIAESTIPTAPQQKPKAPQKLVQGEFPFMNECINPIKYGMGD